ncbi:cytochrome c oxidase subunit CcoM [Phytopseudomonas daroniae]|nr:MULTISPECIES: cytochrome c oxidase subunit CcoM [Pseudomonas]
MFVDVVVLAGIGTVGLMLLFCTGFAYFIWRDARKKKPH